MKELSVVTGMMVIVVLTNYFYYLKKMRWFPAGAVTQGGIFFLGLSLLFLIQGQERLLAYNGIKVSFIFSAYLLAVALSAVYFTKKRRG